MVTIITKLNEITQVKSIILMRHAKSSWKNADLEDFKRPLNERGKNDAPLMADVLARYPIRIDLLISSNAVRALETAKIVAERLKIKLTTNEKLYMASSNSIIKIINGIDERFSNLLIIAHNPGLTNLVNEISNYQIENLPTDGLIAFSLEGRWIDFGKKKCKFLFYEFPKKYR